ncbi:TadE/TadG family type IV pilus assembly protein [Enemella sp. A6]|uniref:TadE/TadG family type IV pilus assembly protein n=1 Tax=Enemella sp. A6 TaxID=3440152 RepID=UPI003EBE8515
MTRDERGAASVEAVVVIPAVTLLLGLLMVGARLWYVTSAVEDAAWLAARSASLERHGAAAREVAHRVGTEQLRSAGTDCADLRVHADVSGLQRRVGEPAAVSVRVRCTVPLADLLVPGTPGSIQVSANGSSIVDQHRGSP